MKTEYTVVEDAVYGSRFLLTISLGRKPWFWGRKKWEQNQRLLNVLDQELVAAAQGLAIQSTGLSLDGTTLVIALYRGAGPFVMDGIKWRPDTSGRSGRGLLDDLLPGA
jgi:hypothetical protein